MVILHIDLDCFFVQVERKRNPLLNNIPVAVRQHQDIICVSYEARKLGVKKHDYPEIAQQQFPQLTLVHVFIEHGKVSLRVYKEEIEKIVDSLHARFPHCKIEQGSIDEVYIDITEEVSKQIEDPAEDLSDPTLHSQFVGSPTNSMLDTELQIGAEIAKDTRDFLLSKFGFTCSAGIANNKMLAKIASGLHKPNKQTVIFQNGVDVLLNDLPLSKLPKLGGKFGKSVADVTGAKCVADLQQISLESLNASFGEKNGPILYNMCRGRDESKVEPKGPSKSVVCGMSLNPINVLTGVEKIFHHLATDMVERLRIDYAKNEKRFPQSLVVGIRFSGEKTQKNHTVSFPKWKYAENAVLKEKEEEDKRNVATVIQIAMEVFNKESVGIKDWAVTRLSLVATNFKEAVPMNKFFTSLFQNTTTNNNLNNQNNNLNNSTSNLNSTSNNTSNTNSNNNNNNIIVNNNNVTTTTTFSTKHAKFSSNNNDTNNTLTHKRSHFVCEECQQEIPETDQLNHADMHFAQKLQAEEDQQQKSNTTTKKPTTPSPSKNNKPNNKKLKTGNSNAKIDDFFKSNKKL